MKRYYPHISFALSFISITLLFLTGLGNEAYWDYDEAAYAHVIDQMKGTGDYMTMHYGGEIWIDKPPLYFWLATLSRLMFGINEFATRLPAAVGGILCVMIIWIMVYEYTKRPLMAFFGAFILATTGAFLEVSRQVRLDAPVTFCILFGFYSLFKARTNTKWLIGIGISIGIGLLLKNVIGLFVLIPVGIYSLVTKDFSWLKKVSTWVGVGIGILFAAPWHIYETILHGRRFWDSYFFRHVIERYDTNLFQNNASVEGYVDYLSRFSQPWLYMFLAVIAFILARRYILSSAIRPIVYTSLLTTATIFILFATAATKAMTYLTPLYPFMALSIILVIAEVTVPWKKIYIIMLLLLCVISTPNALSAGFHKDNYFAVDRDMAEEERIIGLMIRNTNLPIYFFEKAYWETVRVYARKDHLDLYSSTKERPYYLILPTHVLAKAKVEGMILYEGELLALLYVMK
jgi:4-amino-4-deoxy-L-arabinose transferase-like glycosyltransferase